MPFWNATVATPYPGLIENIVSRGWTAQYQQRVALGVTGVVAAAIIDSGSEAGGNPPE
jgi:hypothetical protein